jgi:hypothetical protein
MEMVLLALMQVYPHHSSSSPSKPHNSILPSPTLPPTTPTAPTIQTIQTVQPIQYVYSTTQM